MQVAQLEAPVDAIHPPSFTKSYRAIARFQLSVIPPSVRCGRRICMKGRLMKNGLLALTLLLACTAPASAQQYPTRPVTVVLPSAAGGGPDVISRLIADRLGQLWRQTVVISNKPGGSGIVAAQAMVGVKPDGYTL